VLKIQSLLHICSEHYASGESEEKSESTATAGAGSGNATSNAASGASGANEDQSSDSSKKKAAKAKADPGSLIEPGSHQGLATLGIALLAMGESIGMDMCLRMYNHLV